VFEEEAIFKVAKIVSPNKQKLKTLLFKKKEALH
jgi:hypothetical protein